MTDDLENNKKSKNKSAQVEQTNEQNVDANNLVDALSGNYSDTEEMDHHEETVDENLQEEQVTDSSIISNLKAEMPLTSEAEYHDHEEEMADISDKTSSVSMDKGKSVVILVVISLIFVFVLYKTLAPIIFKDKSKNLPKESLSNKTIEPPQKIDSSLLDPQIPALPETPKLVVPSAPPAPVPPVVPTIEEGPMLKNDASVAPEAPAPLALPNPLAAIPNPLAAINPSALTPEQKQARLKSTMSVKGGGSSGKSSATLIDSGGDGTAGIALSANRVTATKLGDLSVIVAQGKLIDATLETAINTDIAGMLRAVVSTDVFSEAGFNILIPKGSRLIGTYNSAISLGVTRVTVTWTRLIRPDGIDIAINSPGTDTLGRAGLEGVVDNKYIEIFGNTLMLSLINIGIARFEDTMSNSTGQGTSSTSTTASDGTVTTTTSGTQASNTSTAVNTAAENIMNLGTTIVQQQLSALKPTLTVDQGTKIKVFVAQDLIFPKGSSFNGIKVLQ